MVDVHPIIDSKWITQFIKDDPKLAQACLTDEELLALELDEFAPCDTTWLVAKIDQSPVALLKYGMITMILADTHIYTKSELWGTDVVDEIGEAFMSWLADNTSACRVLAMTPRSCDHVMQFAAKHDFKVEGVLPASISWRGKIEDLVLMGRTLQRKK